MNYKKKNYQYKGAVKIKIEIEERESQAQEHLEPSDTKEARNGIFSRASGESRILLMP